MLPIDRTSGSSPSKPASEPKKVAAPSPKPKPTPAVEAPSPKGTDHSIRSKAVALDKGTPAPSNPAGSRALTKKQIDLAVDLTGPSGFRSATPARNDSGDATTIPILAEEKGPGLESGDSPVEEPSADELRSDLKTPEGFDPGTDIPKIPNFSNYQPDEEKKVGEQGVEYVYKIDGQRYTVRKGEFGAATTTFEKDGVSYTNSVDKDGGESFRMNLDSEEGSFSRTVRTDDEGKVTDTFTAEQSEFVDGKESSQTRGVTLEPDGTRTVEEEVVTPEDGASTYSKTTKPNGTSEEEYTYSTNVLLSEPGDLKLRRTTKTNLDGSSETRTERSEKVSEPLESLIEVPKEPDQAHPPGLPEDERGDTTVSQVEVVTTDPKGVEELQYSEETYSQSSTDLDFKYTQFPPGEFDPDREGSSITRTVTRVKTRDEEGKLVESTGVSQDLELVAHRNSDGEKVSLTRTDSWNSAGEGNASFSAKGFKGDELATVLTPDYDTPVGVPGSGKYSIYPSDISDRYSFSYLHQRGVPGAEQGREWLGLEGDYESTDFTHTVSFNEDGVVGESTTYGQVDEDGNGRTVTREHPDEGAVSWTYSEVSNDGKDYKKQTVVEGTELSVYEQKTTNSSGEFEVISETKNGDDPISSSRFTRQELSGEDVRQAVIDGELTQEQAKRLLAGGGPYFVERSEEKAERLTKDGELIKQGDDPVQLGHEVTGYKFDNADGYEVAETYQKSNREDGGFSDSRLSTVTDPAGRPPVQGTVSNGSTDNDGGNYQSETSQIRIDQQGRVFADKEQIGEFDLGGQKLSDLLGDSVSTDALLNGIYKTSRGASQVPGNTARWLSPSFKPLTKPYGKVAAGLDILGVPYGLYQIGDGIVNGDVKQAATGAGFVAGGTHSLSAAVSALSKEGALASRASALANATRYGSLGGKLLGAGSGFVSLGIGGYGLLNAETEDEKVSAGLTTAAGVVGVGSLFFGPPGWLVGGLISGGLSLLAWEVDKNAALHTTAGLDDRLD